MFFNEPFRPRRLSDWHMKGFSGCCGENGSEAGKSKEGTPWEVVAVVLVREDGDLDEGAMKEWIIKKHLQARVDRRGERWVLRMAARFLVRATGSLYFPFIATGKIRGQADLDIKMKASPLSLPQAPGSFCSPGLPTQPWLGFPLPRPGFGAGCSLFLAAHTHKPQGWP